MDDSFAFSPLFLVTSILVALFSLLVAGAGIGGGVVFVGIFYLVLRYSSTLTVHLSNFAIFGGAIPIFYINFFKKHPESNRPLIDYDIALLAQPMTLEGIAVGVLANILFPEWVNQGLLFLLLVLISFRSTKKAISKYRSESKEKKKESESEVGFGKYQIDEKKNDDEIEFEEIDKDLSQKKLTNHGSNLNFEKQHEDEEDKSTGKDDEDKSTGKDDEDKSTGKDDEDKSTGKDEKKHEHEEENWVSSVSFGELEIKITEKINNPDSEKIEKMRKNEEKLGIKRLLILIIVWFFAFLISLFQGGSSEKSLVGVEKCSPFFFVLDAVSLPINILMTLYVARFLLNKTKLKEEINYPFEKGDVKWTKKNLSIYSLVFFFNGLISGMLRIGAGTIISFIFIEMNIDPQVLTATSAFNFPYAKGFWFFAITLIFFPIGKLFMNCLVKKHKRTSFILFAFVSAILISTVLMLYNTLDTLIQGESHNLSHICE
ncbi:sulfite exporter taue/safe [Anaeramoeba ignava]|uniref:Sulfite exporter taue/safe n=1 Tax=Anaeramoeba ignava TaxID=1746090 RepID=A0A9Q0LPX5_ANAIG|nr:sulfite exporter taue/safe [Anaeramoeba ignava]